MSNLTRFERLLQPGQIGKMTTKNRMKCASVTTLFCTTDGRLTNREIDYLREHTKGGAAIVNAHGRAVERAVIAGFDYVEMCANAGYLIDSFL